MAIKIIDTEHGEIGTLHHLDLKSNSALVFQVPYPHTMLTPSVMAQVRDILQVSLPENSNAVVMSNDINVYEVVGPAATALILSSENSLVKTT